ncbi:DUF4199 family protein [Flavihumibacter fluvii]|uniref:DUF4199 family protein n=1 Tax=Flavihumibacter fluvii TaxID=2838157 RepID=UPI001BDDEA3D|nr:DUF4199 family protein [Flavihumibacter fluvii]ULQ53907.1 DUF4199 family protein [Flavihumibacter fluvii]
MTKKLSLITGATAGLLYAAILFATWRAGIATMASFLTIYTYLPAVLFIIGAGAWWLKTNLPEEPDFKTFLQYALLAYLVFELLYAAANYSLFGVLDKSLNNKLVEHLLATTRTKLLNGGAGKDQLEAVEDLANTGRLPLTLKQTAIGLGQNLVIDFLKSLFIATITKQFRIGKNT